MTANTSTPEIAKLTAIATIATIATIAREEITGLILAGGQGRRMGGIDKGLQSFRGIPLARHALQRLSPQVGQVAVNANRNVAAYAAMGAPVWPDTAPDFPGPLAGMLAGLARCETPYLAVVPCDAPQFPLDLVDRLARGLLRRNADLAMAATCHSDGSMQSQPVFCLLRSSLQERLASDLRRGAHKVERWIEQQAHATVVFEDPSLFLNINTLPQLEN
jgi:molybdopterin-guanine dinucleotide biosynthesis protein A